MWPVSVSIVLSSPCCRQVVIFNFPLASGHSSYSPPQEPVNVISSSRAVFVFSSLFLSVVQFRIPFRVQLLVNLIVVFVLY